MAVVWIPSLLRNLTGGQGQVNAPGKSVGEAIAFLEEMYPGIRARLCEDNRLNPALAVYIDGQLSERGLAAKVSAESEIHFLPAIGGG